MTDPQPRLTCVQLTTQQKQARHSRALGLGIALALFAFIIYLASFARLVG